MLLGLMTSSLTSELRYFTQIAKSARKYDVDVCRFTPEQIDPDSRSISGEVFNKKSGRWEPDTLQLPDFVYDRSFHGLKRDNTRNKKNISWLKENIPFLGYGLPGKWELYEALKGSSLLQAFLPSTIKLANADEVWQQLELNESVILKPEYGARGIGIYHLQKKEEAVIVRLPANAERPERTFRSKAIFSKWANKLLSKYGYLCQPFLDLSTKEKEPFDVRILLQKNQQNRWIEKGRGIRLGHKEGITSNIATGGTVLELSEFERQYPGSVPKTAEQTIEHLLFCIPKEMESHFKPLFELGIDLGIDREGKVWILDVNSKPGRRTIEILHPERMPALFEAPVLYSRHLAEQSLKAGDDHEKIL